MHPPTSMGGGIGSKTILTMLAVLQVQYRCTYCPLYQVYGARGRCCPAATVPVAVVFACCVCCCIAEEIQNKIIDRKTELCHHRPQNKAHSNKYENNTHKSFKMGFWVCGSGGVRDLHVLICTRVVQIGVASRSWRRQKSKPRVNPPSSRLEKPDQKHRPVSHSC